MLIRKWLKMSDENKSKTFDYAVMAIMTALVIVTTSFSVPFANWGIFQPR
jgi:hypothetical protein